MSSSTVAEEVSETVGVLTMVKVPPTSELSSHYSESSDAENAHGISTPKGAELDRLVR